jgi:MoxR-like ATPase
MEENAGRPPPVPLRAGTRFSPSLLLADEINRTPPKTQAALLEAMQERRVTVAGPHLRRFPSPFFVLATQNPIEQEGTYPAARGPAGPLHVQPAGRLPVARAMKSSILLETTTDATNARPVKENLDGRGSCWRCSAAVRQMPGAASRWRNMRFRSCRPRGPRTVNQPRFHQALCPMGRGPARLAIPCAGGERRFAVLDGRFNVSREDIQWSRQAGVATSGSSPTTAPRPTSSRWTC